MDGNTTRPTLTLSILALIEHSPHVDDAMRAFLRTTDSIEVNGYGCDGKEITQERFEFWGPDMQRQYIATWRGNLCSE